MIQLQTIPEDTFPLVAKIGTIHAGYIYIKIFYFIIKVWGKCSLKNSNC